MRLLQLATAITVISLLLSSCDFDGSTPDEPPIITYHDSTIVERNEGCDPTDDDAVCCVVEIQLPVFVSERTEVVEKLNRTTREYFVGILASESEDKESMPSIKDAAQTLMDDFRKEREEFPMVSVGYEVIGTAEVLTLDSLVCIGFDSYSFLGGAHGNSDVRYALFKTATGDSVSVLDLVSDPSEFKEQAEEAFRVAANIAPDQDDYAAEGYWFEDNQFSLPEHIGLTSDSVHLHYNQYDIAPYSLGPTHFTLPRTVLK